MRHLIVLITLVSFSDLGHARDMEPLKLFHRCFAQISQASPFSLSNYDAIKNRINSRGDAVDECIQILEGVRFDQNTRQLPAPLDSTSVSIIRTFHQLHHSWFSDTELTPAFNNFVANQTRNFYDTSAPALYYTNALFGREPINSLWSSSESLRARRTEGQVQEAMFFAGQTQSRDRTKFIFGDQTPFAERGDLIGVFDSGPLALDYYLKEDRFNDQRRNGNIAVERNFSFGAFGTTTYLLTTVDEPDSFVSNGAQNLPRRWAKRVFNDLLCRSLPVVRTEDVTQYVVQIDQSPEFRKTVSCNQCHASMDRIASTMRHFRYLRLHDNNATSPPGGYFMRYAAPNLESEPEDNIGWTNTADSNFWRRPPKGIFYFRDYKGVLHDQVLSGPQDIAGILTNMDDPYLCVAKRYYQYFTGVDVTISDPGVTVRGPAAQSAHYNNVVTLGQQLRQDTGQSVIKLIENILRLDVYQKVKLGEDDG